jgi:ATPase subunit of ABC transporter with duplicated ATPase domains
LIVVSHDRQFLHDIGVTRWLELTDEALRTRAAPTR